MTDNNGTKIITTSPDPTLNVSNLLKEAVKRIDDVTGVQDERLDEKIENEKTHIREILTLRADYDEKLRDAEAKRIDAIRAVDVNAVSVASERATQSASVLATQVTASAETLRALVATQATTTATQLTQIITPITDRLALLEKAQYEGTGKSGVTDPIFTKLNDKIESLDKTDSENVGKGIGTKELLAYIAAAIGIAVFAFNFIK